MKENDISKMLPDWTLTYVLSESGDEKIYLAEKEAASSTKFSLVRAVFIPCVDEKYDEYKAKFESEEELRAHTAEKLAKTKREFAFLRSMSGKGGWLNLRESYDISDVSGTKSLAVARFDCAQSLSGFIDENGFTQGAVLKMGIDVCRGLERARKAGRLHGTITPDKVFVDENCKFRIGKIDLDVSDNKRLSDLSTPSLAFTAPYAPRDGLAHFCDTYAVGLMMYYFLNDRKLPFEDELSREEAIEKRLSGAEIPKPKHDEERITAVVMKACSVAKKQRYPTPYVMRKELEEVYVRLEKELEEKKLRERAEQKKLEKKTPEEREKEKDISAVRERKKDETEIRAREQERSKRHIIAGFTAAIAVFFVLLIGMPKLVDRIDYKNLSRHKIQLASNYYKGTDKEEMYAFDYEYDGSAKEPEIVMEGLEDLVEGRDYKVEYKDNVEVGKATITVRGIGEYKGKNTRTFNVKPQSPGDIAQVTATEITSSSVTLTWSESENANRYIIYKFHEDKQDWGDREYEVDGAERSIVITGLKAGKEYSFRVRGAFISESGDEKKGTGTAVTFTTKSE